MWKRATVLALVVWPVIYAVIDGASRSVSFMDWRGDPDNGFWLLVGGFVLIGVVGFGVPWVRKAA